MQKRWSDSDVFVYIWASEASPTLGCSIEVSRDMYIQYVLVCMSTVCQNA